MLREIRHLRIVELLRARAGAPVVEIADELGVSASTIRRDLEVLGADGVVRRTFGGAMLAEHGDEPLDDVARANAHAKAAIAARAVPLVPDGATVALDIGTTALALARLLRGRGCVVVTPNMAAFALLSDDPTTELLLPGGSYRHDYRCVGGPQTVTGLAGVRADVAFLGCSGLAHEAVVRDTTDDQPAVKRALAQCAERVFLLADATKMPGKGSHVVLDAAGLDGVITDGPVPEELGGRLLASGVEVLYA